MSKTVDHRVVEMQFNNKQFEAGVAQSMSTIDKLKQRLNFKGASKGLENVSAAAKNVNMSGLGAAVETVRTKFSALEVMGVTALANITNSAVNAGKRIVSALTIDPITTGFSEYETKINSIQTIMTNTASKGTTMADVTRVIDELNTYADQTIYNFAEMTRNIGTFTAAGVGLEESAAAIKGIANLAAASGSNSQQASTAMYQLSQALAAGTVKLMDWNSVVNAGMGGELFQEALKDTAREMGVSVDSIIEKNGSFRDSLQEGWLSADILNTTLKKFTKDGAKEYAESMVKSGKYTKEQADAILKQAEDMEDAATKVKTFTQLWDTLKESAQSGWSKTWELIVGDFEEARELFSKVAKVLGGFIDGMSDARNNLIEGALDFATPWTKLTEKLESLKTGKIAEVAKKVGDVTKKVTDFQNIVSKVWKGDYGNSDTGRFEKLDAEGWDHRVVQDLVNLGRDYEITVDDIEKSHKKFGLTMDKSAKKTEKATVALEDLSDEELKNAGLTDEEIKLYRDLAKEAEKTGTSIEDLAKEMSETDGRTLLIESLSNAGQGLVSVFTAIKDAWVKIFPPMSVVQLYNIIKAINTFSENLTLTEEQTEQLQKAFEGLFALLDIVLTLIGGPLKLIFSSVMTLLEDMDIDLLDIAESVGTALVKFRDWIDENNILVKALEVLLPYITDAAGAIKEWFESLKESDNLPRDIIAGLVNGIKEGIPLVLEAIGEVAKSIIDWFCNLLGIQSPSTVFIAIGGFIIAGLIAGLSGGLGDVGEIIRELADTVVGGITEGIPKIWKSITNFVGAIGDGFSGMEFENTADFGGLTEFWTAVKDFFGNIDFGEIAALGVGAGIFVTLNKLIGLATTLAKPLEDLGDLFEGVGVAATGLGKAAKGWGFKQMGKGVLSMAIAIGVMAVALGIIANIDSDRLWPAVGALAVITLLIGAMVAALTFINKIGADGDSKVDMSLIGTLLGIAAVFAVMTYVVKQLTGLNKENALPVILGLAGIVGALILVTYAFSKFTSGEKGFNMAQVGAALLGMAAAILIMVFVIKQIDKLDAGAIIKGLVVIGVLELMFAAIIAVSSLAGEHSKAAGKMLFKMAIALGVMVAVVKLASMLEVDEIIKGVFVVGVLELLFVAIIEASALAGQNASKAGGMLLMMSAAILILVGVIKIVSQMDDSELKRGLGVVAVLELLFAGLIAASKLAGEHAVKAGTMLILMSTALLVLTGVIFIISKMDPNEIYPALGVVAVLEALFGGLMICAGKVKEKSLGVMIAAMVAVGILIAAVIGLSFMDPQKLTTVTACLSALMLSFAGIIATSSLIKTNKVGKMIVTLGALVGVVAILALIVAKLTEIKNVDSIIPVVGALSILMGAMAVVALVLSKINAGKAITGIIALTAMVVPLIAFAGSIWLIGQFGDLMAVKDTIIMLVAVIGAMTLLLLPLTLVGSLFMGAILGVVALTAMIVPLIAFAAALWGINKYAGDLTAVVPTLMLLLNVMTNMTLLLIPLTLIGFLAIGAIAGIVALTAMVVPLIAFAAALKLINVFNVDITAAVPVLTVLLQVMNCMVTLLERLAPIAVLATVGVVALGALEVMILAIIPVATAIGALITYFPKLQEFVDTGLQLMIDVAGALGEMISAFMVGATSGLPEIGTNLSGFMENLSGFISGASNIPEDLGDKITSLAGAIVLLTAADLLNSITSFISSGSSLSDLGTELSSFMMKAMPFIMLSKNLDASSFEALEALAGAILVLTAADIIDGLTSWFTGGVSLADFGEQLAAFGPAMAQYGQAVNGIDPEKVKASAEAAKILAEMASNLPNSGGWLGKIFGENDADMFGEQLAAFGKALNAYDDEVIGLDTEAISASVSAGESLAQLADKIPNCGGMWAAFTGDNTMDVWGLQLVNFGASLNQYDDNVAGLDTTAISNSVSAGESLAALADVIPNCGGMWAEFTGDNTMDTWGQQLVAFARHIKTYSIIVAGGLDVTAIARSVGAANKLVELQGSLGKDGIVEFFTGQENLEDFGDKLSAFGSGLASYGESVVDLDATAINSSISAATRLAGLAKTVEDVDLSGVKDFGKKIKSVGSGLSDYCDNVADIDNAKIQSSVSSAKKLVALAGDISSTDFGGLSDFGGALEDLADVSIDNFIGAFDGADTKVSSAINKLLQAMMKAIKSKGSEFAKEGSNVIKRFVEGVSKSKNMVSNAVAPTISAAVTAIRNKYQSFYNAGSYLVSGFAKGISENAYKAKAKATAMATAAKEAAEEALGIQSPSKVFYQIGDFAGQGFVNALDDYGSASYNAGSQMADSARSGLSNAIGKIRDLIDGDIDMSPTISPVLDLSNVEAGARTIGSLFNTNSSVGVLARANAVGSMMAGYNQNGANEEVVSAINKLRKDLGNVGNSTTIVNGVTYDDGTNVSEAVKGLIRAAKIERRV